MGQRGRRRQLVALVLVLGVVAPPAAALAQVDSQVAPRDALTVQELHSQVDLMLLHLNEALFALSSGDVRIARSQFKQFFDRWDDADDALQQLYPERYDALDLELERAEIALLHRTPEDVDSARFALRALRSGLLEIAHDLEAQLQPPARSADEDGGPAAGASN